MTAIATQVGSGKGSDDMFFGAFTIVKTLYGKTKNDINIYKRNKRVRQNAIDHGSKYYSDISGRAIRTEDDVIVDHIYEDGNVYEINPDNGKKLRDITSEARINYANKNISEAIATGKCWAKVYKYNGNNVSPDKVLFADGLSGTGNNIWRESFKSAYIVGDRWYRINNGNVISVPYVIRRIGTTDYFLNCDTLRYDYYSYDVEKRQNNHALFSIKEIEYCGEKDYQLRTTYIHQIPTTEQMNENIRALNKFQAYIESKCVHCSRCIKGMPNIQYNPIGYGTGCPCKNCKLFYNNNRSLLTEKDMFVTMN